MPINASVVHLPDEYLFLHEAAVIEYHGTLFAAWYNNKEWELDGFTPIRERRSSDGGITWSEVRTITDSAEDGLLCCPPVFGIDNDILYLLLNRMSAPDHIHSLELYQFNEASGNFIFQWSKPIPFKLNTNVYQLPNGKLFLAGRIAEKTDMFPDYPAGLISDSGRINGEWRSVRFQTKETLPDGMKIGHAECSAVIQDKGIYIFCRNDAHAVPLMYRSHDSGENWEGPFSHNIPFANSKIYSGTLSDGRNYVIGNLDRERSKLAIFFSEPGTMYFTGGGIIHAGFDADLKLYPQWSYPAAYESNGNLYVIYTMCTAPDKCNIRGAMLSVLPLQNNIKKGLINEKSF